MLYDLARSLKYRKLKDFLIIAAGSALIGAGISFFLVPDRLAAGGVSGIGIILYHLTGGKISVGLTMLLLNIPLFIFALKKSGIYFICKTAFGTVLVSVFVDLGTYLNHSIFPGYFTGESGTSDLLLFAVCGGVFTGAGLGMVYLVDATTGGSDLLAKIISMKKKDASVGKILFAVDAVIVFAASVVFRSFLIGIYATVAIFVASRAIDGILEGFHYAKALFIISSEPDKIRSYILYELERGATALQAKGLYTMKESNVIFCVVRRKQLPMIKENIRRIDPSAFIVVTDVKEVFGEGF